MDKSMICPRCLKNLHHGVHTCTPTPLVRELETEIERLRAELAVARSELAVSVGHLSRLAAAYGCDDFTSAIDAALAAKEETK